MPASVPAAGSGAGALELAPAGGAPVLLQPGDAFGEATLEAEAPSAEEATAAVAAAEPTAALAAATADAAGWVAAEEAAASVEQRVRTVR